MRPLKHLPFERWPVADRRAWETAYLEGDIFDETRGPGAHLAPGSRRTLLFAYRRWLGFLATHHPGALGQLPAERIVSELLRDYLRVLQAEGAATTTAIAVHGLYLAARLLAPQADWAWLRELRSGLVARAQPQDRFDRLVPPWQVLDLGLAMMEQALGAAEWTPDALRHYRDGLLLALLALWPIRRRSLAALTVGQHVKHLGDHVRLRLHPEDTKTARAEDYVPHEVLMPYLDRYLRDVRPRFSRALGHDGFWASARGRPLSGQQLYTIVRRRTEKAFGKMMALHDIRRAAATFLAVEAPARVGLIPGVLQQTSPEVSERHYNLARSTAASRRFAGHVSALRKRLGPARLNPGE